MSEKNDEIRAVSAREHIRLRPAMYVGSIGKYGTHHLVIDVLRALCEPNHAKTEINLSLSDEITTLKFKGTFLNQFFNQNSEGALKRATEYGPNTTNYNFSLIPALFHLTSHIEVSSQGHKIIVLNEGEFDFNPTSIAEDDWLCIDFKLDDEIFEDTELSKAILATECEKLAALCNHVQIELIDSKNGSNYREKFSMEGGLVQLFNIKVDQLHAAIYESVYNYSNEPVFHVKITEPELALELVFMFSTFENNFENTYYQFLNLKEGGSHVSYFKSQMTRLTKKLDINFKSYNLITNIETKHPFPFVGPTKNRIEDPSLVQIMKKAFDQLQSELIAFYSK